MSSEIESPTSVGSLQYGVYREPADKWHKTRIEAEKWCVGTRYKLADIMDDETKSGLAGILSKGEKAWIHSWRGDTYNNRVVLHWNGSITPNDPEEKLPFAVEYWVSPQK